MMQFLPVTMKEMQNRGVSQPDFVYVCGDAYVEEKRKCLRIWRTKAGIFSLCRKYGFDGKSLYRFQKAQKGRLVFSRRENGLSTGPCSNCVWEFNPSDL